MPSKTSTTSQSSKVRSTSNYQGVDTRGAFSTISSFSGYRSREDKTLLPQNTMIYPSQNVLIDITGRLKIRPGYTLYGQANASLTGIYAWYDWEEHKNGILNFRAYSGNLQFDNNGVWTTIKTGLGTNHINFTNFWDITESQNVLLFVDGSTNIYEWSGGTATYASSTVNTITKQGTDSWKYNGFYSSANKKITINGVEYTYTGGESTTTLTGVTPDPTGAGILVGDLAYQSVVTTLNSGITGMITPFNNDGISNLSNQIYLGCLTNNAIVVSKVNNYHDVSFSNPRIPGEGARVIMRAPWVAFEPQESEMYISAGKSQWYQTKLEYGADTTVQVFGLDALKTSAKQAALGQKAISHDRNSVVMLTNETRLVTLGRTLNIFGTPMMTDYSYPIAKDFNGYDFTDASLKFWKSYILVAIPKSGKWLILNQTDPNNIFWEAPQIGSFSGFMEDNSGNIYAHGYSNPETYKLFDGGSDNGHPILARAQFSYYDYHNRGLSKYYNEFWMEGYISSNTILKVTYNYDLDGCATVLSGNFYGNNNQVVCSLSRIDDGSLGKHSLGKEPLGGIIQTYSPDPLPPYFSAILVAPRKDFYKLSPVFESYGTDFDWQILTWGPLASETMYGNNALKINLS